MVTINVITLTGNVGQEPKIRQVGDNKVASFSIATTRGTGDNRVTDWHNCTAWNVRANIVEDRVHRGTLVTVVGSLQYRSYEKDGVKFTAAEINVNQIVVANPQNDDDLPA